jgi:hypothetical protein
LLQPIWNRKNMVVGHLPIHVPPTMFNDVDGEKEKMSTMYGPIPLAPIWVVYPLSCHA